MPTPTVDDHFSGRAAHVREIYRQIVDASSTLGPVDEDPKKTSIHLNRRVAFAGVQTRRDALILTLKSDRRQASPRPQNGTDVRKSMALRGAAQRSGGGR